MKYAFVVFLCVCSMINGSVFASAGCRLYDRNKDHRKEKKERLARVDQSKKESKLFNAPLNDSKTEQPSEIAESSLN